MKKLKIDTSIKLGKSNGGLNFDIAINPSTRISHSVHISESAFRAIEYSCNLALNPHRKFSHWGETIFDRREIENLKSLISQSASRLACCDRAEDVDFFSILSDDDQSEFKKYFLLYRDKFRGFMLLFLDWLDSVPLDGRSVIFSGI